MSNQMGPRRHAVLAMWVTAAIVRTAGASPTTGPATCPTPASDVAEVARLIDIGLPTRDFLTKAWADHAAKWRVADAAGDADAACLLGLCLRDGIGRPADDAAALSQLDRAARRGSTAADVALGLMVIAGHGTAPDPESAFKRFTRAAEAGDPQAMVCASMCASSAKGITHDPAVALRWAERAADADHRAGLVRLATVYQLGVGLPTDPEMAGQCLRRAIDLGSIQALSELGKQIEKDPDGGPDAARSWFERAAAAGDPLAMARLSALCLTDLLGPRDYTLALDWARKGADTGDPTAILELGRYYESGLPPVLPRDPARAVELYRQSIDHGGYAAMGHLGHCLLLGTGVKADLTEARRWLRRGAEAGEPQSMAELGLSYFAEAAPHDSDPAMAFRWSRRAAEEGDTDGMRRVAACYLTGIGQPVNGTEALRWLRQAALAGDTDAMNSVGLRYSHGDAGIHQDQAEAIRWFEMAARHGGIDGMLNLTDAYANGKGVPIDGAKAEHYALDAERAAEADGNRAMIARADVNLCRLYLDGRSGRADLARASAAAAGAAAAGEPLAWGMVGYAAENGDGVPKDPVAALHAYQRGADLHDSTAMAMVAHCWETGTGCDMDIGKAAVLYNAAAKAGSTYAMVQLGLIYMHGAQTPGNYAKAAGWLRQASDKGDVIGTGDLALLMGDGAGVPQDMPAAIKLARRAAEQGKPEFLASLAEVYFKGRRAIPRDAARGRALLQEAADHGHAPSRQRLAQIAAGRGDIAHPPATTGPSLLPPTARPAAG
jgi:TPR repeat protein